MGWLQGGAQVEQLEAARHLLEDCLATSRSSSQRGDVAFALRCLSAVAFQQADLDTSLALAKEARDLYEDLGDQCGIAAVLQTLAAVESTKG